MSLPSTSARRAAGSDAPAVDARRRYDAFHRRSLDEPEAFWSEAAQLIDWSTAPGRVFEARTRASALHLR